LIGRIKNKLIINNENRLGLYDTKFNFFPDIHCVCVQIKKENSDVITYQDIDFMKKFIICLKHAKLGKFQLDFEEIRDYVFEYQNYIKENKEKRLQ